MLYTDIYNMVLQNITSYNDIKNISLSNKMMLEASKNVININTNVHLSCLFDCNGKYMYPHLKTIKGEIIITEDYDIKDTLLFLTKLITDNKYSETLISSLKIHFNFKSSNEDVGFINDSDRTYKQIMLHTVLKQCSEMLLSTNHPFKLSVSHADPTYNILFKLKRSVISLYSHRVTLEFFNLPYNIPIIKILSSVCCYGDVCNKYNITYSLILDDTFVYIVNNLCIRDSKLRILEVIINERSLCSISYIHRLITVHFIRLQESKTIIERFIYNTHYVSHNIKFIIPEYDLHYDTPIAQDLLNMVEKYYPNAKVEFTAFKEMKNVMPDHPNILIKWI